MIFANGVSLFILKVFIVKSKLRRKLRSQNHFAIEGFKIIAAFNKKTLKIFKEMKKNFTNFIILERKMYTVNVYFNNFPLNDEF